MIQVTSASKIGDLKVIISNGAHPSSVWAKLLSDKIIQVSDTAIPVVREQARAFKARIELAGTHYIDEARRELVNQLAAELENQGQRIAAEYLRAKRI